MRILAIRGCNLASLAGEFEIDLEHGPLGAAGVFAIVGNTGAGKSTLLDALCVALFDRTPRLTNHSRVVVGRGEEDPGALGAQDVRTLLRRGAASGFAEVDFESGDGRRYRARWSVRRARGQTDGTIQPQQVALTSLDGGERLGGTKTETLDAIHARLGLSFDQFRRSALLAQGEFATFLRADGKDRSELLERMTGTEIYSRLSVQAHLRANVALQHLTAGRIAADAIAVLDDEARRTTEAELVLAEQTKLAARARHSAAETAARWVTEAARRDAALVDAVAAAGAAETAVANAQAERSELALRRRAELLRGPWDEAARLDRQLAIVRTEVSSAAAHATDARCGLDTITLRRASLAELHAPIRAARIAAGLVERPLPASLAPAPSIAARARTTRGVEAATGEQPSGTPASARARSARGGEPIGEQLLPNTPASELGGAVPAPALDIGAAEAFAQIVLADAEWVQARTPLAAELATWAELDAKFAQHAQLADTIGGLDRILAEHTAARDKHAFTRKEVVEQQQLATAKHADAQRKADGFQKRRGLTLDAARRHEDEARARLAEIDRLVALASNARQAALARMEIDRRVDELKADGVLDHDLRLINETARATAVVVRAERTRVVDELRKAAGYEHARTELVDGEPCPLCGAAEHPWRDRGAFDDVIAAASAKLTEVATDLEVATATIAAIDARSAQRTAEQGRLAKSRATAVATSDAAIATWREQLQAIGELSLVGDPSSQAAEALGVELHAAGKKRLDEARTTRSQTEAATKAAADAQADVQLCQAAVDQLAARFAEVERRAADLEAQIQGLLGERAGRIERRDQLAVELDAAIARWTAVEDEANVRADRAAVELAGDAVGARGAQAAPNTVGPAIVRAATAIPLGGRGAVPPLARTRTRGAALTGVAVARAYDDARLWISALAVDWRARAERVAVADAALAAAAAMIDRAARDGERAVAEHQTRLTECHKREVELVAALAAAVGALEIAHSGSGFDLEELRTLLSADPSRVEVLVELLAALERAIDTSRAVVTERRRLVDDHAAARPASIEDVEQIATIAALLVDAEAAVGRLASILAADEDARARRVAALVQLASAEAAADVDRILGEVIGSHDGKLFRSFAQSLTLDGLLAVANSHLEELAPRYQLERVPGYDLELQVIDRDLGHEIRSVQSLSGGESFLVSLALALGLSSMSAHDVRVRTLLIDEGFGTLDPATLDSALSVLDALQARGRQVGVISHVPALVERVGAHVRVVQRGGGRSEVIVA